MEVPLQRLVFHTQYFGWFRCMAEIGLVCFQCSAPPCSLWPDIAILCTTCSYAWARITLHYNNADFSYQETPDNVGLVIAQRQHTLLLSLVVLTLLVLCSCEHKVCCGTYMLHTQYNWYVHFRR